MLSRHTRAAIAAGAAGAAYYAAAALGSRRPVRLGGLLLLSVTVLAGQVAQSSRASAKAYEVEGRLNQFFNGGGQVGGNLVVNGNHTVTGDHTIQGSLFGNSGVLTVQDRSHHMNGAGLYGNLDLNSNTVNNANTVNLGGVANLQVGGGIGLSGNLSMNNNNINNCNVCHAASYQA